MPKNCTSRIPQAKAPDRWNNRLRYRPSLEENTARQPSSTHTKPLPVPQVRPSRHCVSLSWRTRRTPPRVSIEHSCRRPFCDSHVTWSCPRSRQFPPLPVELLDPEANTARHPSSTHTEFLVVPQFRPSRHCVSLSWRIRRTPPRVSIEHSFRRPFSDSHLTWSGPRSRQLPPLPDELLDPEANTARQPSATHTVFLVVPQFRPSRHCVSLNWRTRRTPPRVSIEHSARRPSFDSQVTSSAKTETAPSKRITAKMHIAFLIFFSLYLFAMMTWDPPFK